MDRSSPSIECELTQPNAHKTREQLGIISFILFLVQSFATHMDISLLHAFEVRYR